jgi:putative ABC transport system permease protein
MFHFAFLIRQIRRSRKQSGVFVLCVMLSMVSLIALNGFSASVNQSLMRDARQLNAGDVIIRSNYPFGPGLTQTVDRLVTDGAVAAARLYEFYAIARSPGDDRSVLSMIKVAGRGYPFYGRMSLASGRPFSEVYRPGTVLVERLLLDRLGLKPGDSLNVGSARLSIGDIVTAEPDRPVSFFSFGPRVFVHPADLDALDLVTKGSRIRHKILLKVTEAEDVNRIAGMLQGVAAPDQERVDTYMTVNTRMKRFFDNFLFFLNLVGVFTLLLAGIGIQSSLTALLKSKNYTMAIIKTVGATSGFVTRHYVVMVTILGLTGTVLGVAAGSLIQYLLPSLFKGFLPAGMQITISWMAVLESLALGLVVVTLFAYLPVYRLRGVRPTAIFRKESPPPGKGLPYFASLAIISGVFVALLLMQLNDTRLGIYFIAGIVAFILVTSVLMLAALWALSKWQPRRLTARQAVRGLFRPGNATRAILITLTASLSVLFIVYLVEANLDAAYVKSYPDDAPNVFFIDIQPDQVAAFRELVDPPEIYPIIRSRIRAINGIPVDRRAERQRKGDNFAREFNLTYRQHLLEDERIIDGGSLFRSDWKGPQVSVLDTVVDMRKMVVGDVISFNIQGVPLEARISSIRTRVQESISPFFYFVFPESVLEKAPQTLFAAVRMEKEDIAPLQNKVVAQFPNISVIDITETARTFATVMDKLSGIIRFFTAFSIGAGLLILISAIFATRAARIREAVYFKIVGAKRQFVARVFLWEHALMGMISAAAAMALAQTAGAIICRRILDITYHPFPMASLVMLLLPMLLVAGVGHWASLAILRKKPVTYLRENNQE